MRLTGLVWSVIDWDGVECVIDWVGAEWCVIDWVGMDWCVID